MIHIAIGNAINICKGGEFKYRWSESVVRVYKKTYTAKRHTINISKGVKDNMKQMARVCAWHNIYRIPIELFIGHYLLVTGLNALFNVIHWFSNNSYTTHTKHAFARGEQLHLHSLLVR